MRMRRRHSSESTGSLRYEAPPLFLHSLLLCRPLDYDRLYRQLDRWEGIVGHMYLDTHKPPLVTVGAGNMLSSVSSAQALPFRNVTAGRPATRDEIAHVFEAVGAMPGALPASHYRVKPILELPKREIKELAVGRLRTDFIPKIKTLFWHFDDFPLPAREAIIDIAYNAGIGKAESHVHGTLHRATGLHGFHRLISAIDSGDWMAAARASHRFSSRPERNKWTRDLFEEAAYLVTLRDPAYKRAILLGGRLRPPFP